MTTSNRYLAGAKDILIIAGITALLYALVDSVFGLLYTPKPYESHRERLSAPAYLNEPYFSEEFLVESFSQPGMWLTQEGTRLVFPAEFHGRYFNVDRNQPTGLTYRRTVRSSASDNDKKIVLVLGGSTVYCSEVPDEHTLPSELSRFLNKAGASSYTVLNAGVASANSLQDVERLALELERGLRPAIVLAYTGVNDALQGVYFGDPDGVMFEHSKRPAQISQENSLKDAIKSFLPEKLVGLIRQVRTVVTLKNIYGEIKQRQLYDTPRKVPAHMDESVKLNDLGARTARNYLSNMRKAQELAGKYSFRFMVVLQPHIYSARYLNRTADLSTAGVAEARRLPEIQRAFNAAYPELRLAIQNLSSNGVEAFDLSDALANKTQEVFLDSHHINSVGNKQIAERLGQLILAKRPAH